MASTTPSKFTRVNVIIGVAALAITAGYVGGLSGQRYIDYLGQFVLPEQQIQTPKSSRALSLSDLIANTSPSLVSIYRLDDVNTTDALYPLPLGNAYIGDAVAVASDGWMVVPTSMLTAPTDKKTTSTSSYVGIYKQTVYPISQTIPDALSGVSFLKMEGTRLKPASFAWEQSTTGSIAGHIISSDGQSSVVYLTQPHYSTSTTVDNFVTRTTTLAKRFNPDTPFSLLGSAVVGDNGDVMGLTQSKGIIPVYRFRTSLDQVLTAHTIKHNNLNVSYYDNAWMPHTQFVTPALSQRGNTIIDPGNAVSSNPPHGLQKGDVVLHVNNENVDINRSLSDVLTQYNPGDTIHMGVIRDNTTMDITLTLK